ncbi:uncharacterized protein B0T15DRAFT_515152 [Chaetomium strumarium]|uniref:Uncharacterized protein n=1 Tax=Chaetomium strumarium TaxID=1170767 RepID=A0AAJ0GZZ7_9PEZI|nr:hypothetical protein B0T15DRAFT_515152 [Chaetomium strumarium]
MGLLYRMELRFNMYGEVAGYPPGFTPPGVHQKHRRETEAWIEQMEAPTPSDCSDDGDILSILNFPRSLIRRPKERRDAAKRPASRPDRTGVSIKKQLTVDTKPPQGRIRQAILAQGAQVLELAKRQPNKGQSEKQRERQPYAQKLPDPQQGEKQLGVSR